MLFARAAPPGSRLLSVTNATSGAVRTWATRARDGTIRIVLVNTGKQARSISVGVAGGPRGRAALERLTAPAARARTGVELAGQSFAPRTFTGLLAGRNAVSTIAAVHGPYVVTLPGASAAMLLLSGRT
jgi:hypothetical protein